MSEDRDDSEDREDPIGSEIKRRGRVGLAGDALALRIVDRARATAWDKGLRRTSMRPRRSGIADGDDLFDDDDESASGWKPGPGIAQALNGPGPSKRDPRSLGAITQRLVRSRGWSQSVQTGSVVGRWRELVGENVADNCHVETFEAGELVVRATSTAWATQLRLLLPQIEKRIALSVGENVVDKIVVLGPGGPTWKKGPWSATGGRGPRDTYG